MPPAPILQSTADWTGLDYLLHGGCHCGRNRYIVQLPKDPDIRRQAQVIIHRKPFTLAPPSSSSSSFPPNTTSNLSLEGPQLLPLHLNLTSSLS